MLLAIATGEIYWAKKSGEKVQRESREILRELQLAKEEGEKLLQAIGRSTEKAVTEITEVIEKARLIAQEKRKEARGEKEEEEKQKEMDFVPDEKQLLVYRLADGGLGVEEIARRMSMGKGEVELILNLRRGRKL